MDVKGMEKVDLDKIPSGKGKVDTGEPKPIYLNFKPEDEVYQRLEKVRKKYGTKKVKNLLIVLIKNAEF